MTVAVKLGRFLEIGPRPDRLGADWTTVGIEDVPYVDVKAAWGFGRLPFEDETFEKFYACHVIEHIPWWLTVDALREAWRVLKPGGEIEIHTIDFGALLVAYALRRPLDGWTCHGRNPDVHFVRWIASRLFAYGDTVADPQWHKSMFDESYLSECLVAAGFQKPERAGLPLGPEKHGPVNLGMKAVRP